MRQGWTVVKVPRKNLHGLGTATTEKIGNQKHYREICDWCGKNFGDGTWVATIHAFNGEDKPGTKRFAFKHPKHATLFTIKWL